MDKNNSKNMLIKVCFNVFNLIHGKVIVLLTIKGYFDIKNQ